MAKSSNGFFSKLAPEDKRFIKRVGIYLFILLFMSGAGLYLYTYLEKQDPIPALTDLTKTDLDSLTDTGLDTLANAASPDTNDFELPPAPELPEFTEDLPAPQETAEVPADEFDVQAHLQLMRQNAGKYNYKQAYKHGARIASHLLAKPELSVEWGHVLLEAGKPADAVSALQKGGDHIKSEASIDMAFALHRSGNTEGAINFLDNAIKNSNDLNLNAAKAAIISEHPDMAERAAADSIFKNVLKSKPLLPYANYQYGRLLMQKGDYQNSKIYLEHAVKAMPDEPRYIARLGMAEFYLKRDASAETLYRKALKINPYDYNTWFNLGELYLSKANESGYIPEIRNKTRMALESYLKTIENDSLHANAHYRIGLILNGNGGHKEAILHLSIALEKMPGNIPTLQQLSSAYMHLGDTAKSIRYLKDILRIDPFDKIAASEFVRINGTRD